LKHYDQLCGQLKAKALDILTPQQKIKRIVMASPYAAALANTYPYTDEQAKKLAKMEEARDKALAKLQAETASEYERLQQAAMAGRLRYRLVACGRDDAAIS
jgi:hypothetical protein